MIKVFEKIYRKFEEVYKEFNENIIQFGMTAVFICLSIMLLIILNHELIENNSSVINIKTNIKQDLYLRGTEFYKDEYVDLWYDLHSNFFYDKINYGYLRLGINEKFLPKLKEMSDTIDKLINIYGKNFPLLIPQKLLVFYIDKDTGKRAIKDTDNLGYLKLQCDELISISEQKIEDLKKQEELNGKIVYGGK